jgi:hypothetical protein
MLINCDRKAKPYFVAQFTTPNTYLTNHTGVNAEQRKVARRSEGSNFALMLLCRSVVHVFM